MKTVFIILVLILGFFTLARAQTAPGTLSTDPQQIENLIQSQGCRYEVSAAAQTIATLQKQINDLQKQLAAAKDPPKKK